MENRTKKYSSSITSLLLASAIALTAISCSKETSNKHWEYKIVEIEFKTARDIEPFLNEYGKAGWELLKMDGKIYIFKR